MVPSKGRRTGIVVSSRIKIGRNDPCPCGSGLKHKKCCLLRAANQQPPEKTKSNIRFGPNSPRISFEDFSSYIESLPCDPHTVAASATRSARIDIEMNGMPKSSAFHAWQHGAIILAAFNRETLPQFLGHEISCLNEYDVQQLLYRASGVYEGIPNTLQPHEKESEGALLTLRLLCGQTSLQGDYIHQIARTLYLLELEDIVSGASLDASAYDILFQEAFGCNTREYASIMLALWAHSQQYDGFSPEKIFSESSNSAKLIEILRSILDTKSCETRNIRSKIHSDYKHYRNEALVMAFFSTTPVLKFNESVFLCGPHPYMRMAAYGLTLFQTLALAREHCKKLGQPSYWTNEFSERMGNRFEELVAFCLKKTINPEHLFRQHRYLSRKGKPESLDSPDFGIFNGDSLVLIQAKLKSLSPGAFFGYDLDAIKKDVHGALGEAIWKSIKYLFNLEKGAKQGRLNPENETTSRRVLTAGRIFLLGVVNTMPPIFHMGIFRQYVESEVKQRLNEEESEWFDENRSRFAGWHIVDSEELMAFVAAGGGITIFRYLIEYVSRIEFGNVIVNEGIAQSFRSWFLSRHCDPRGLKPIIEMQLAFNRSMERSIEVLFRPNSSRTKEGNEIDKKGENKHG